MDNSEAVANFMAITGADETAALATLEATGFELEAAINLHFAGAAAQEGGGGVAGGAGPPPPADDEAMARRLYQ